MSVHLYLNMIPESLVASMLPPEQFGAYLATGTHKRPHGQAAFFQVRPDLPSDWFDLSDVETRCVPHPDGRPKHSVYLGIYRVMEHVPLEALMGLYLVTAHGKALEIQPGDQPPDAEGAFHLYQELCPVHPLIASNLAPERFCSLITDRTRPIWVPRICFLECSLGGLADDPVNGSAEGLPYRQLQHLRDCLVQLQETPDKETKTVDRVGKQGILYRCVKTGFFVGDQQRMLYYRYPSQQELETEYFQWWRCANDAELQGALSPM